MKYSLFIFYIILLISLQRSDAAEYKATIWVSENNSEFSFAIHSALLAHLKANNGLEFRQYEYGRALTDYQSDKPTCLFNRRISSLFKDGQYSDAITKYKSRELFFRSNMKHDFSRITDSDGLVSLHKLFKKYPDRVLLVGEGLTYGDKLDHEIKQLKMRNLYVRVPSGHDGAYMKMFRQGKVDYLLEYPISFKILKVDSEEYSSFKVSSEEFTAGRLVCNKPTSREVIKYYNNAIKLSQDKINDLHRVFGFTD